MQLTPWGHLMTYAWAIVALTMCFHRLYQGFDWGARPSVVPFIVMLYLVLAIQALAVMMVEVV